MNKHSAFSSLLYFIKTVFIYHRVESPSSVYQVEMVEKCTYFWAVSYPEVSCRYKHAPQYYDSIPLHSREIQAYLGSLSEIHPCLYIRLNAVHRIGKDSVDQTCNWSCSQQNPFFNITSLILHASSDYTLVNSEVNKGTVKLLDGGDQKPLIHIFYSVCQQ